jgi:hypothetical protein
MDHLDQTNNDKGFMRSMVAHWSRGAVDQGHFGNSGLFRWSRLHSTVKRPGTPVRNAEVFALTPEKIHTGSIVHDLRLNVAQYPAIFGMALKPNALNRPTGKPDHESPHTRR